MPRVIINLLCSRSGGAMTYVRNLVPRIAGLAAKSGILDLHVLCDSEQKDALPRDFLHPSKVIIAPTASLSGPARLWWEKRCLSSILASCKADLHFVPYQVSMVSSDIPQVLMVRNMEPFFCGRYRYGLHGRLRNWVIRRTTISSINRARRVIAVSNFVQDYLVERLSVDKSRLVCIHHGRDTYYDFADGAPRIPPPIPFFFTCGSLLPYRRCEDVITAFAIVLRQSKDKNVRLIVAGTGTEPRYRRKLESIVRDLCPPGSVEFTGNVDKKRMREFYHQCLACVLATEIETISNLAIEAMASRCAIIASQSPPMPEILANAALYYPARDVNALSELMLGVLKEPARFDLWRHAAGRRAQDFDWNRCARLTFDTLASALGD